MNDNSQQRAATSSSFRQEIRDIAMMQISQIVAQFRLGTMGRAARPHRSDRIHHRLARRRTARPGPGGRTHPARHRRRHHHRCLKVHLELEVLEAEFLDESQRTAEVTEVMNYVTAAERGLVLIKTLPVCLRRYGAGELRRAGNSAVHSSQRAPSSMEDTR
jgi:hypothetical protein